MANTQDNLPIEDIKNNLVFLKDGGAAVIVQTTAVNFGLLSAEEQIAIIGSFAQMINSLSFPIQITILSRRLDISAYLKLLEKAQNNQTNPLLSQMMIRYRRFIQSLIKDNEVLDKQFYITVPLSSLEVGIGAKNKEEKAKKVKTILDPKKDQIVRQLNRVGLTAKQLNNDQLLKFFYETYNPPEPGGTRISGTPPNFISLENPTSDNKTPPVAAPTNSAAPVATPPPTGTIPQTPPVAQPSPITPPAPVAATTPLPPPPQPIVNQPTPPVAPAEAPIQKTRPNHPFVVEELQDNL